MDQNFWMGVRNGTGKINVDQRMMKMIEQRGAAKKKMCKTNVL